MENQEIKKKFLNQQQTKLRKTMTSSNKHKVAIRIFLDQHARLHATTMAHLEINESEFWSYEDAILTDLSEGQLRRIPQNCEHSIVWCIWHIARIEDVAMNILVAGTDQILEKNNWFERMKVEYRDTGNEMDGSNLAILSNTIDIETLRAYRIAVGRRTREIVKHLQPEQLKSKVDPDRIQRIKDAGALVEAAYGIADYWSKRNIAGLLLMPATRHNLVHLNEALKLKRRRQ